MILFSSVRSACLLAALGTVALCPAAHAAEHVTLKNGFEVDCVSRETIGERVRLHFTAATLDTASFLEVAADAILRVETLPEPTASILVVAAPSAALAIAATDMGRLLANAGQQHHIDVDMLASVIKAESGGHVRAVSRTGAKGLMQLMPATATQLGVKDSFQADQNISGGTTYLDQLLLRYHDDIALALAAYNAGPGAVDRWHGIPPYRETQAYVARVIGEFNRRKQQALLASAK